MHLPTICSLLSLVLACSAGLLPKFVDFEITAHAHRNNCGDEQIEDKFIQQGECKTFFSPFGGLSYTWEAHIGSMLEQPHEYGLCEIWGWPGAFCQGEPIGSIPGVNDYENMGTCFNMDFGPVSSLKLFCIERMDPEPPNGTNVKWELDEITRKGYEGTGVDPSR